MEADRIILSVPARDEYARTVRMAAASVASRAGVPIDLVDDVRIAVDEAYILACSKGGCAERITFTFVLDDAALQVTVGPLAAGTDETTGEEAGEEYARFILEAVCDEFEFCEEDGEPHLRLLKRLK